MNKLQKQLEKLASEKTTLQRERADLQRQCSEMTVAVDKLNKEKASVTSSFRLKQQYTPPLVLIVHQWCMCIACVVLPCSLGSMYALLAT